MSSESTASEILNRIENKVKKCEELGLPELIGPEANNSTMTVLISKEHSGQLGGLREEFGIPFGQALSIDSDVTLSTRDGRPHTNLTFPIEAKGFGIIRSRNNEPVSAKQGQGLETNRKKEFGIPDVEYGDIFYVEIEEGKEQINYAIVPALIDEKGRQKGHMLVAVTDEVQTLVQDNWNTDKDFRKAFVAKYEAQKNLPITDLRHVESTPQKPTEKPNSMEANSSIFWTKEQIDKYEREVGPALIRFKPGVRSYYGRNYGAKKGYISGKHTTFHISGPGGIQVKNEGEAGTYSSGVGLNADGKTYAFNSARVSNYEDSWHTLRHGEVIMFADIPYVAVSTSKAKYLLALPPAIDKLMPKDRTYSLDEKVRWYKRCLYNYISKESGETDEVHVKNTLATLITEYSASKSK